MSFLEIAQISRRSGTNEKRASARSRSRRAARLFSSIGESLEERIVLSTQVLVGEPSPFTYAPAQGQLEFLTGIGIMTASVQVQTASTGAGTSQADIDFQAVANEFVSLSLKSGITVADLADLDSDFLAIAEDGPSVTDHALASVVSELANDVASGTPTTQAQADFAALYSGSGIPSSLIDQTFSDLVQTIDDSHVTTTDLATVAADETAFANDANAQSGGDESVQQYFSGAGASYQGYSYMVSPPVDSTGSALSNLGVLTDQTPTTVVGAGVEEVFWAPGTSTQLISDEQTLQTELETLAEKSGVTVSDLSNVDSDDEAIIAILTSGNRSGSNPAGTQTAVAELATAITSGASTAQAQTDFNASFVGIPSALLDKTFEDLAQEIEDSHVTAADLAAVTTDTANVQSAQPNDDLSTGTELPISVVTTVTSGSDGIANVSVDRPAANAGATTTSANAAADASVSTPNTIVVAISKHKEKRKHTAVKVVTHAEVHRSKVLSKGQETKERARATDRPNHISA
jgi:hypothetical protein